MQERQSQRTFELGAALLTALGHLVTNELGGHGVFIVVAVGFWVAYAVFRARRDPETPRTWGLQRAGLSESWRATLPIGSVAILICLAWGALEGRIPPPAHAALLILLYPIWGVVQQVLVQGFVVRHLDASFGADRRWLTVACGALAFGIVHAPHLELMAATFVFGLVATPIWLRHRNVWPLAFWHGAVGAFFYYLVLGRDPWLEAFG